MPRRRDRGFLDGVELWSPRGTAPGAVPPAFATIARTFEQIDRAMLAEIRADIERNVQPSEGSTKPLTSTSRFSDTFFRGTLYSDTQAHEDVERYIEDIEKGISHTSSEADNSAYLTNSKCVTAWSWVHSAVLEYQGRSDHHYLLSWTKAKIRANEILDLALAVLETYDSDECRDLLVPGREGVGVGIEAKLRTLSLFNTIYSRPTYEDDKNKHSPGNHAFDILFNRFLVDRREDIKARRKTRYARTHHNRDVILVTATLVAITISTFPLGLAFYTSTNKAPGSTSDSDFWLLIQNSLMQILSLATTTLISPAPRPGMLHVWVWPRLLIWTMAMLGLSGALIAPVLYIRMNPIYSALISSLASGAQACLVLQLALFVDVTEGRMKMD